MTNSHESRPAGSHEAAKSFGGDTSMLLEVQVRRRAARRLVCLSDGRQDPQFDLPHSRSCGECGHVAQPPAAASDFGLTRAELVAEGARLKAAGWSDWEIRARLADPRRVAA